MKRKGYVVPDIEAQDALQHLSLHRFETTGKPMVPFTREMLNITDRVGFDELSAVGGNQLDPDAAFTFMALDDGIDLSTMPPGAYESDHSNAMNPDHSKRNRMDAKLAKLTEALVNPTMNQNIEVEIQMHIMLEKQQRKIAKEDARARAKMAKLRELERQRVARQEEKIRQKHEEAIATRAKALAEGKAIWVETFDPDHQASYYFNHETGELTWEKPEFYIVAAEDDEMKAVIRIQCMYRGKLARREKAARDAKDKAAHMYRMKRKYMSEEEKKREYEDKLVSEFLNIKTGRTGNAAKAETRELEKKVQDGEVWVRHWDLEKEAHYYHNYLSDSKRYLDQPPHPRDMIWIDWTEEPAQVRGALFLQYSHTNPITRDKCSAT